MELACYAEGLTLIRFDRKFTGPANPHFRERKASPPLTAMERVWTRLKTTAIKFAEHKRLISVRESRNTVLKICRQEKANSPPPDALQYLATELVRLTLEGQFPG